MTRADKIVNKLLEASGFDAREYFTRRLPDEEELRLHDAVKKDWGWEISHKDGSKFVFIRKDPMWTMVLLNSSGRTLQRWNGYLSPLLTVVDYFIILRSKGVQIHEQ
jgi:hypothetical protein